MVPLCFHFVFVCVVLRVQHCAGTVVSYIRCWFSSLHGVVLLYIVACDWILNMFLGCLYIFQVVFVLGKFERTQYARISAGQVCC